MNADGRWMEALRDRENLRKLGVAARRVAEEKFSCEKMAAGYEARNVKVSGALDGSRITLAGRAAAYGGTATAKGFIVTPAPGRPLAFDLRGRADNVDLRGLPGSTGAPKLATDLSVAEYHVEGQGRSASGTDPETPRSTKHSAIGQPFIMA